MGTLDRPEISPLVDQVRERLQSAAFNRGVKFSEFASEITLLFLLSTAYEPAPPPSFSDDPLTRSTETYDFFEELVSSIDQAVEAIVDTVPIRDREDQFRDLVTGPDLFHWLTQTSGRGLEFSYCPFPSRF